MPVTITQLRANATVDLMTAARALGHLPHPHRRAPGAPRRHR
jgi:hypothetical protein